MLLAQVDTTNTVAKTTKLAVTVATEVVMAEALMATIVVDGVPPMDIDPVPVRQIMTNGACFCEVF